jgi:hypothetical protein
MRIWCIKIGIVLVLHHTGWKTEAVDKTKATKASMFPENVGY